MHRLLTDLCAGVMLLTRLPVAWMMPRDAHPHAGRAVWTYPVVGIVVGGIAAAVNALLRWLGVPPLPAAFWTVAVCVLVTGGLHEDGLADTADGFGGGATRESKLSIMRDSRIGTYGVLAVALSLAVRASCLATLPAGRAVACALIAAGACGRGCMIGVLLVTSAARPDGLAASLRRPRSVVCAAGILIAAVVAATALRLPEAALAVVLSAATALATGVLAQRQIGGYTGDVLGAAEQIAECLVLTLVAAASE